MTPNEHPVKKLNLAHFSEEFRSSKAGQKFIASFGKKKVEKIKNQDIIDFRYWLINQMYPGSVPETASTSFIAGKEKKMDIYEKAVYEEVLLQFNNHFGVRGYDIG